MNALTKAIFGFLGLASFLVGAAFVPFIVWTGNGGGSNPLLGSAIAVFSVLIPWAIGFWFIKLALRASEEEETQPTE